MARTLLSLASMLLVLTAAVVLTQSGAELNAKGEALLASGQFREAQRLFRRASQTSPRLSVSYFNEALALAGLRRTIEPPRPRPSKKSVLDVAEVALRLDPTLRGRAEAELPSVRTTFRGQRALGRRPEQEAAMILQAIVWRSRGAERLDFLPDGQVRYCRCRDLPEPPPPPEGSWSVDGNRITITFGTRTHEGTLGADGVLSLGQLGRFFDW